MLTVKRFVVKLNRVEVPVSSFVEAPLKWRALTGLAFWFGTH